MRPLVRALLHVLNSSLPDDVAPGDEAASPATQYATSIAAAGVPPTSRLTRSGIGRSELALSRPVFHQLEQ